MKVAIIGSGQVGAAAAMAIAVRGFARELVLIDVDKARAQGVATDMRYGIPLCSATNVIAGDYEDLVGARVVIVAAGLNEKAGGATDRSDPKGRLRLLEPNARIFADIVPQIVKSAPRAVILVASNPPEALAAVARQLAGHERVLSTSTCLDSLRFRTHLAQQFGVSPASVEAHVVGEHGTSSVFLWSSARIGGESVQSLLEKRKIDFQDFRSTLEQQVRYANISIIEGIGASQYGIGMVCSRISEAIANDEGTVYPVGSHNPAFGTTVSLPSVLTEQGVKEVLEPEMSAPEREALQRSAETIADAVRNVS